VHATIRKISADAAQSAVAMELAAVELFPYHSRQFDREATLDTPSVGLARSFVQDVAVPRARRGECGIVVARGNWAWKLAPSENVVVYQGPECVSAGLGPNTRGGRLILRMLAAAP
jgi:hypothetical protein